MINLAQSRPRTLSTRQTWVAMGPYAVIALIVIAMHWPGLFTLPPLDRDESRYAQATVQMFETGDFVEIRFQDDPRNKKPVGIHWLQAASVGLFSAADRREIWAFRLPSLLGVLIACLVTYWGTSRLFNPCIGFLAALLLSSTVVVAAEATIAKTDGVLLACLAASQFALAQLYVRNQHDNRFSRHDLGWLWRLNGTAAVFWVALALGTLVKGPVAPVVTSLTCATLIVADRRLGWMKGLAPLAGMGIALAIVLPWVVAIWVQTGGQFFVEAFLVDVGPKMVSDQETHGAPPGYYTVLAPLLLWPASLFVLPALYNAWRVRLTPAVKFFLAWIVPAWIFFEIAPTKLPHYVLPTFPAIAALCAMYIFRQGTSAHGDIRGAPRLLQVASAMVWLLLSAAIAAFVGLTPILFAADVGRGLLYGTAAIATVSVLVYFMQIRALWQSAAYGVVILAAISYFVILQIVLPSLSQLDVSRRLAAAVEAQAAGRDMHVISSGYAEPSFVFLTATDTDLVPPGRAADLLAGTPDAVAAIEERNEPDFIERANALSLVLTRGETVEGLNYSKGDEVRITLFTAEPAQPRPGPDAQQAPRAFDPKLKRLED